MAGEWTPWNVVKYTREFQNEIVCVYGTEWRVLVVEMVAAVVVVVGKNTV